jgi:YfiH family protein
MYIKPTIFGPEIIAAQSTRRGGVSQKPFDSLNLGLSVSDREEDVLKNREIFFGSLGISFSQLSKGHQVHGNKVIKVETPGSHSGFDAQITNVKGVFLVVSIADCTPILIHDETNNAVAAIHAGWRGTAGGIVVKTMELMKAEYGTEGKDCKAFIGACITYSNFEVGAEVAEQFSNAYKRFDENKQKWFVDLKSCNRDQLISMGVLPDNIEINEGCTVGNNGEFFSHRKEKGKTGRMMAVIGLR